MLFRWFAVPELWYDHVVPPSVVARITPFWPTAKHVAAAGHDVEASVTGVGFWSSQVPPCAGCADKPPNARTAATAARIVAAARMALAGEPAPLSAPPCARRAAAPAP